MSDIEKKLRLLAKGMRKMAKGFNAELVEQAADRIATLQAPFILTDEPPTVPGYYWMVNESISMFIVQIDKQEIAEGFDDYSNSVRWSSAPLPIPEDV